MAEEKSWTEQWFEAQQQFVNAWSDMANSASNNKDTSHSRLWSESFDLWRQASPWNNPAQGQQTLEKCMEIGREYFSMAEQIGKSLAEGNNPVDAVHQWMEQLKVAMQQLSGMPGFDPNASSDFMQQWFNPGQSWQQMMATMIPGNQTGWQTPGFAASPLEGYFDAIGNILSAPGIGFFREKQEKQQLGIQLAINYQQANYQFNQSFLRVAIESIEGFQSRLSQLKAEQLPTSLRGYYDLWVEVSESYYGEYAMGEEYQKLYGNMVNRLMALKKHVAEVTDENLKLCGLPNNRDISSMQQRLQQLRRENIELRREIAEIRQQLVRPGKSKTTAPRKSAATKKTARKKSAAKKKASTRSRAKA